jgi:cytochrome b involved in lipid metabolism
MGGLTCHFLSGKDATEAFEDVGHSDEARELLADMLVGEFEKNSVRVFTAFFDAYAESCC